MKIQILNGRLKNKNGFTLIEVLVSIVIMTIGMIGLLSSFSSVTLFNQRAQKNTTASMYVSNKMEEIKRAGVNEPTGNTFGFDYLVSTTGYLSGMTQQDNWTYLASDTVEGISRTWTLEVYPTGESVTFATPSDITMIQATVTGQWTEKGTTQNMSVSTIINRRQFMH